MCMEYANDEAVSRVIH